MKACRERYLNRCASAYLIFNIVLPTQVALAETYVITTMDDLVSGRCTPTACSLRDAILAANARPGSDTIAVPQGVYRLSRVGRNEDDGQAGDLDISDSVTIEGEGPELTIIDGLGEDRVIEIHRNNQERTDVSIKSLTITGGNALANDAGIGGSGGGILSGGSL